MQPRPPRVSLRRWPAREISPEDITPAPTGEPPDVPLQDVPALLPLRHECNGLHYCQCSLCHAPITGADTVWRSLDPAQAHRPVCYSCGVALMIQHGYLDPEQALAIPAIGGG